MEKQIITMIVVILALAGCAGTSTESSQTRTADLKGIVTNMVYPQPDTFKGLLQHAFDPRYGGFETNPLGQVSIYRQKKGIQCVYTDTDADGSNLSITVSIDGLRYRDDGYTLNIHAILTESKMFRGFNYSDNANNRTNRGVYNLLTAIQDNGGEIEIRQNDFKTVPIIRIN